MTAVGLAAPQNVTPQTVDQLFTEPAGRSHKGEFAFALSLEMEDGAAFTAPTHIRELFDYLYGALPLGANPELTVATLMR